ncbi:hypothetical protein [uncultured Brachybacterium sp.]|uniref:hypothetical protein n=1 Tax=uncultured Brachybacterium sp. TaxID=189680 RepID=UPI00262EE9A8|nr:hypothetical protein [uncultured Brachybacterium sp.]
MSIAEVCPTVHPEWPPRSTPYDSAMTDAWTVATAVGTIAAAVVPGLLFLVERKDRKKAQSELDAELTRQAERERARATEETLTEVRRVAIWNESDAQGSPIVLHLLNGSAEPIYQVWTFTESMHRYDPSSRDEVRSKDGTRVNVGVGHWDVLMPGEHVTKSTRQAAIMPAWVEFNDVRQRGWRRYNSGKVEDRWSRRTVDPQ